MILALIKEEFLAPKSITISFPRFSDVCKAQIKTWKQHKKVKKTRTCTMFS